MRVLRTPDDCFRDLTDFPYEPNYVDVGPLRIHYVDAGPGEGAPVLLLHGEPTWSYLYRKVIPPLLAAGHRVLAPDLVGFGRSDKLAAVRDYTFQRHVDWMTSWLERLDLRRVTLFGQDWGSLIGLRLVSEHPERFVRVVIGNGGLPDGTLRMPPVFHVWRAFSRYSPVFPIGRIVRAGCARGLSATARAAYDAPFPSSSFKAGARAFPSLVPTSERDPAVPANRRAWQALEQWEKPFLTTFGDRDAITRGGERILQRRIPGTQGQPHTTLRGAGHFLQEDSGAELAEVIVRFIAERPA